MPELVQSDRFRSAVRTLRHAGVVPGVARPLADDAETINMAVVDSVIREVPAYTASGNPDVLPELRQHIGQFTEVLMSLLSGRRAD